MKRFFMIVILLGALLGITACTQTNEEPPQSGTENEGEPSQNEAENEEIPTLTAELAQERSTNYKQDFLALVNEQNENEQQNLTSFQTKAELKQYFQQNGTSDFAARFTESNFIEAEDGVSLIARGGPIWLGETEPFELEQLSETEAKLSQEQKSVYLGHVILEVSFKFLDDHWLIDNVEFKEVSVEATAETVLNLLADKDMENVAAYVHQEKGLLFSPYAYIEEEAPVFSHAEVERFFHIAEVLHWGVYDGSGMPIELTPPEYYEEFIYTHDFQNADEIVVNEVKQRGNTINNIKAVFPNAVFVEYHQSGTEEYSGMDWSSLTLVFEQLDLGEWKLVAIVHDQWTI